MVSAVRFTREPEPHFCCVPSEERSEGSHTRVPCDLKRAPSCVILSDAKDLGFSSVCKLVLIEAAAQPLEGAMPLCLPNSFSIVYMTVRLGINSVQANFMME